VKFNLKHPIVLEIAKATKTEQKPKEDASAYLLRLTRAAVKAEESVWDSLSTAAQAWVNSNIGDDKKLKSAPSPLPKAGGTDEDAQTSDDASDEADESDETDTDEESDEDDEEQDDDEDEEDDADASDEDTETTKKAKKAKDKTPMKSTKKTSGKDKGNGSKRQGTILQLQKAILKNPKRPVSEHVEALEAKGLEIRPATVSTTVHALSSVLRALRECGFEDLPVLTSGRRGRKPAKSEDADDEKPAKKAKRKDKAA
jgi:cobalamin biosynthesis protein CobT